MKNILAAMAVFATASPWAAQSLPTVQPLVGEVVLRLNPAFSATCSKTSYEKKDGSEATRSVNRVTTTISEDQLGSPKLTFIYDTDNLGLRLLVNITPDRTGFSGVPSLAIRPSGTTSWTDSEALTGKDKEQAAEVKVFLAHMIENMSTLNALGRTLRHGTVIGGDVCKLFPGASQQTSSGGFAVAGTAILNGRKSVVLSGTQSVSCSIRTDQLSIDVQGWYAIDVESGLKTSESFLSKTKLRSSGSATGEEESECKIAGSLQGMAPPNQNAVEQRLIDIKSLFDKGLISKDQFEQKRVDILKSL